MTAYVSAVFRVYFLCVLSQQSDSGTRLRTYTTSTSKEREWEEGGGQLREQAIIDKSTDVEHLGVKSGRRKLSI